MEKRKVNKGFTLIEMVLVLLILSLSLGYLNGNMLHKSILHWNMKKLESYLFYQKRYAQIQKQKIYIQIHENRIESSYENMILSENIYCNSYELYFLENGNINKGGRIICSYYGESEDLIIHLGSGDFEIE